MSQYFDDAATGETLWNPANTVAQLFFRMAEALVPVAGNPCGVVDLGTDEYSVEPEVFTAFVNTLVTEYLASNHPIFKAMLGGWLPQAMVMVQRSGRTAATLSSPTQRSNEAISLNVDAFHPDDDRRVLAEQ